jgi:hypothetical protein
MKLSTQYDFSTAKALKHIGGARPPESHLIISGGWPPSAALRLIKIELAGGGVPHVSPVLRDMGLDLGR